MQPGAMYYDDAEKSENKNVIETLKINKLPTKTCKINTTCGEKLKGEYSHAHIVHAG